jgi:hypothetical protein
METTGWHDGGVVDQCRTRAEPIAQSGDGLIDLIFVTDVRAEGNRRTADFCNLVNDDLTVGFVYVQNADFCAFLREANGNPAPDAARRTGH